MKKLTLLFIFIFVSLTLTFSSSSSANTLPEISKLSYQIGPTKGEINLTWKNPVDPNFLYVEIYLQNEVINATFAPYDSAISVTLEERKTHQLTAIAVYKNNQRSKGVPITITLGNIFAPDPVDVVSKVTNSTIQLTWNKPEDDDLSHYLVYKNGKQILKTTKTSYVDKNLQGNTTNIYEIKAVDIVGNTNYGHLIKRTTLANPPSKETFKIKVISDTAIQIFWNNNNANDTEYRLDWSGRERNHFYSTSWNDVFQSNYIFRNLTYKNYPKEVTITAKNKEGVISDSVSFSIPYHKKPIVVYLLDSANLYTEMKAKVPGNYQKPLAIGRYEFSVQVGEWFRVEEKYGLYYWLKPTKYIVSSKLKPLKLNKRVIQKTQLYSGPHEQLKANSYLNPGKITVLAEYNGWYLIKPGKTEMWIKAKQTK